MKQRTERIALMVTFLVGFLVHEWLVAANPAGQSLWDRGFSGFVVILLALAVTVAIIGVRSSSLDAHHLAERHSSHDAGHPVG
jgi:hypothetical protein